MKLNSLKFKVLLWFGSIVAVILVLFSLSFRYFLNQSLNENIKTKLYHQASDSLAYFVEHNSLEYYKKRANFSIAIFKNEKQSYISEDFPLNFVKKLLHTNTTFYIQETKNDETLNAFYILREKGYRVVVYDEDIDKKIEDFEETLLFLDPILFLLLIFLASSLIDKILLPIKEVTKTAHDISVNDFSTMIEQPKENDEIKELVDSFNEMIIRLKNGVENLNRFNNDVSHELKTPLTVIKGEIQITLRKIREPKVYEQSMKVIYFEAQQMQTIVENLLLLTKYSKENIVQSFEECKFDELLLEVTNKASVLMKEKNIVLELVKIEPVVTQANRVLIYSIFSNLMDNAIKYSNENSKIYISLSQKNNTIHFTIKDEGIGIKESQILKITDRFYRVDKSRNKKIKGFGLGLSIVKNSVLLHKAKMEINSIYAKGTEVSIKFFNV